MKNYTCSCGKEFDSANHHMVLHHHVYECPDVRGDCGPGLEVHHDPVHNPAHYTQGGIETWDFIQAKLSPEAFEGWLVGNIMKYIVRYPHKNGLQDLEKAQNYLSRLIGTYKGLRD